MNDDTVYDLTLRVNGSNDRLGQVIYRDGASEEQWRERKQRAYEADIMVREVRE